MTPVGSAAGVYDAIDRVKASAPAYCTNFFPIQKRLEAWVGHEELFADAREGAVFFFRKDRDLWHVYFGAKDVGTLLRTAGMVGELRELPVVADVVGSEPAVAGMIGALEPAGFRRYGRLQRMARAAQPLTGVKVEAGIHYGEPTDCGAVTDLLESSFDRFADQLPTAWEIAAALANRQILVVKSAGTLAALLHFETQGLSSTLRYWAVAAPFRSQRLGSGLMRQYFESQSAVRRFMLWVASGNRNAVEKYEHYGYQADGLIDHVLANEMIPA
jgi:ribosomal protein S18 acetylase RimI-like enzyme